MKVKLLFICMLLAGVAKSQMPDLFPELVRYRNSGWIVEPSLTYQLNKPDEQFSLIQNDTTYTIDASANAKFGGAFVFGVHHWIPMGLIINDIDYGIGAKYFAGSEQQNITQTIGANAPTFFEETPNWKEIQATFTLNLNRIFQTGYSSFLKLGIGADANYRVMDKRDDNVFASVLQTADNKKLLMQTHASIGYGFAIGERWYLTPKLEIPLFDLNDMSMNAAARKHFLIRQRPILFTLQFTNRWMRKQDGCGPGEKPVDLGATKRKRKKDKGVKNGQLR
jgi:hypothetical protein